MVFFLKMTWETFLHFLNSTQIFLHKVGYQNAIYGNP